MALSGTRLGNAIADAIIAENPNMSDAEKNMLRDYWKLIADEIVSEIVNNAYVTVNVTSVTGVTPGGGTSGPGSGSGTIS